MSVNQDTNDETLIVENFKDVNFPALGPNYYRRPYAHHTYSPVLKNFQRTRKQLDLVGATSGLEFEKTIQVIGRNECFFGKF